MTPTINTHLELLTEQLSCLFRYVNDKKIHRKTFGEFSPLVINGDSVITYQYQDLTDGRSVARILVDTENRLIEFTQYYNFGVLLNTIARLSSDEDRNNPRYTVSEYINRYDHDEATVKEALIDLEYAISIVTENLAHQVVSFGG